MEPVVCIENLNKYPQLIETVVTWLYSEWGSNNRSYWESWVRSSLSDNTVPQTFIILVNGEIAGTYSLWRCDLQSRQDLFPWFGGFYVAKKFRGKVIDGSKLGIRLLDHAVLRAKEMGYRTLYLFTEKNPRYYESNGWEAFGTTYDENDKLVTLCRYQLEIGNGV